MDNVEESLLSGQLGSSYVVGRPRIATVTINTIQPAPVSSTTNAVAMPHPSPHGRSVATCSFVFGMPTRCINNCSPKGRGLSHGTRKISDKRSKISSKLLEVEDSNLVHNFVLGKTSGRTNNFSEKGRGLGHMARDIFGIRSNIF